MAESTVATRSQPQAPAPVPQRAAAGMFPSTKKVAVVAGGRHTDIVVSEFSDRFLVVLTQFGKIGTVIEASVDAVHEKRKTYTVRTALGSAENPLLTLVARQLIAKISTTSTKNLVLCVTLHPETEMGALREIMAAVDKVALW